MRSRVILAAVAAVAICATGAEAATNWFSIHGGTSLPQGPWKDDVRSGFSGEVAINHMFDNAFGIGGRIAMNEWNASDEVNAAVEGLYGPGSTLSFNAWSYSVYGIASLPMGGPVSPYVRAGGSLVNPRLKLETPFGLADETNDEWGLLAGGGLNVQIRQGLNIGVDAVWQSFENGFTQENTSWVDVRAQVFMQLPNFDMGLKP